MQRQKWIDILKGIGIISVVVGHVSPSVALRHDIFMFHMPLFFLIGGWLHGKEATQREYLRKRAISLLLPYISYLLILWPVEILIFNPGQQWTPAFIIRELLKPMLLGGPLLKGYAAVFWFVTCYFVTQQLVHYLLRHCGQKTAVSLFAAMLMCAYLQAWLLPASWLPWNLHTVLFAAPLYYLGYRAHEVDIARFGTAAAMVAVIGVVLNFSGLHNYLDLKYLDYGLPLITLASAVGCVIVLAVQAQWLGRYAQSALAASLASLGTASMTIMFTHQFIHLVMAGQLGVENVAPRVFVALSLGWLLHRMLLRRPLLATFFVGLPMRRRLASVAV